jgi:hypothetical protein
MLPDELPDFTGLHVKVYCPGIGEWAEWTHMDEPVFRLIQGKVFLVGRMTEPIPEKPTWWGKNKTAYILWDCVKQFFTEKIEDRLLRRYGDSGMPTTHDRPS